MTTRMCHCKKTADVYAIDPYPNGWGGYYCHDHIPSGFTVTDTYTQQA